MAEPAKNFSRGSPRARAAASPYLCPAPEFGVCGRLPVWTNAPFTVTMVAWTLLTGACHAASALLCMGLDHPTASEACSTIPLPSSILM